MRILQLMAMVTIFAVGIRWAIREGSKPPEEHRRWVWGYDDDGNPIYDEEEEIDVEQTLAINKELSARIRM